MTVRTMVCDMETNQKIKKGDKLRIRLEWQDSGDDSAEIIALEDEDGGRVRIEFLMGLPINPSQIVETYMVEIIV